MTTVSILSAFLERLEGFTYVEQPEILWPGMNTDPPSDGMWLVPSLFPNETIDPFWDPDVCVRYMGFFQVLVHFRPRPRLGLVKPMTLAEAVIDYYPKGLVMGPVRVKKKPWASPVVIQDSSVSYIPVTVPYLG